MILLRSLGGNFGSFNLRMIYYKNFALPPQQSITVIKLIFFNLAQPVSINLIMHKFHFTRFGIIKRIVILLLAVYLLGSFKNREVTWVAIGDSITYLNDHPDETKNRVTKGYLTDVVEKLPWLHYINKGYNGWTSGGIAAHIDSLGLVKADLYTVFLGTNDWWQGRPVGQLDDYEHDKGNATVYGSFRIIINKIRSLNPAAKIVLITPMQRADFVYVNDSKNKAYGSYKEKNGQYLETFANAIDSIGDYGHIPVVDLYHNKSLAIENMVKFKRLKDPGSGSYVNYKYPESTQIPFNPSTDNYPYPVEAVNLTFDGLHPSDAGNAIIAKALIKEFRQIDWLSEAGQKSGEADPTHLRWNKYISLTTYLMPFWKTDTITDETIQVIKDGNKITANLLFDAKKILSVRAANYSKVFVKGRDWGFKNGKLIFGPSSTVPFFNESDLVFNKELPGHSMGGKVPGTYVLFSESAYFSSMQIAVTYIKTKTASWQGPVPQFAATTLPNTISKLNANKNLKIVFFGNSIEAGYNASGLENVPPYMPTWPELIVYNLKQHYSANITYANTSVPGKLAQWGRDSVAGKVISQKPDLVIIGFGMNDGTGKVPPAKYLENIKAIVDSTKAQNPDVEFILIAPMLANPQSVFDGLQPLYKQELDKLATKGVVVADITGVHQELLKHKTYQDMTGNNVNHPNDYLVRWYAQFISGFLIK